MPEGDPVLQTHLKQLLVVGLTGAASLLLWSCESTTTPPPRGSTNISSAPQQAAATSAAAQAVVVVGTGNPAIDVPAVQAAVDRGGDVVLEGHFSFDAPATKPVAAPLASGAGGQPPAAEILIAKAVSISGGREEDGGMTTIERGTIPFYVDAPGQSVTIRGLHFVDPKADAIVVYAVQGLEVAASRIEGAEPFRGLSQGIAVVNVGGIPNPATPGHPENVSGTLRIVDNDIDMTGGTRSLDNTLGITVFNVGVTGAEVDAHVAGNRIRNTTEPAINFRRLVGRAYIEHNVITTGSVFGNAARNQAVRIANTGSYRVAHNSIACEWALADAEGIGVFSQFAVWPMEHAVIVDNDIQMRPPAGTVFTAFSAGIGVYGFARNNVVRRNTIRGAALAGLSIPAVFPLPPQAPATPQDNAFLRNRFDDFTPSDADIFVGDHAVGTRIVGRGTIDDRGTGTIIVRPAPENRAERNDHACPSGGCAR
jgi:hypothetical protein